MAGPKLIEAVRDDLWKNNPVTVQILGICSTLAVTNLFLNTLIMGLGLTFVTAFSALTISLLRNVIPQRVRMMVQVLVISSFVVIVDISLPDKSGIEVARSIRSRFPGIRILIVSMHSKIDYIVEAFQAGATGYIVKESASDRLILGLETVLNGEYFLDSSISHAVVEKLLKAPLKPSQVEDADYGSLTPREQEVMRLLAEGFAVREIAEKLYISPKTVENHRSNLMRKLGLQNAIELVRYAARLGLIDVDLWKD